MRLVAITDRRRMAPDPRTAALRLADRLGPALVVVLREADLDASALLALGEALQAELAPRGARLLISDRADVARALGAGVQLKESSFDVSAARAFLGPSAVIGASRHDAPGVLAAHAGGADFVTISPVFESPGKGPPLGIPGLQAIRAAVPGARLVALGGITADNARSALEAGADAVAAISAAWAPDLALASRLQV
jgi:thiamine-phosphate pyrophosphorylase